MRREKICFRISKVGQEESMMRMRVQVLKLKVMYTTQSEGEINAEIKVKNKYLSVNL